MENKQDFKNTLKEAPFKEILGQANVKQQLKSALMMNRHVILVGPPGVGKTTLVRNLSTLLPELEVNDCGYHCTPQQATCPGCISAKKEQKTRTSKGDERFIRVQGSPDLTAEDLLGDIDPVKALEYGPLSLEAFTPGKIFKANNGILFFDEVNRCSEKLQNALLQVLEEGKLTIGSYDIDFEANFIFIGTMNPDDNSTEPLSDVFLDRFDLITMSYPETQKIEEEILESRAQKLITIPPHIKTSIVELVRNFRDDKRIEKAPSVRATIGLAERAQSNAFLAGRTEVTEKDVGNAIDSVLAHRIRLKPSTQFVSTPEQFLKHAYEEHLKEQELKGGDR